jgi:hypothetical protein
MGEDYGGCVAGKPFFDDFSWIDTGTIDSAAK